MKENKNLVNLKKEDAVKEKMTKISDKKESKPIFDSLKKYNIIYADPPWQYNDRKLIRKDGKKPKAGMGAVNHYKVMPLEDICNLPVKDITEDNAALFLWSTPPYTNKVEQVMNAWGFRYITYGFVWVKTYANGDPFFGMGYYTKSNVEICFLGIKGKMKPISNHVSQIIMEPHPRNNGKIIHSKKPDIVRTRITDLFGDLPRLEMFARTSLSKEESFNNWDVWGDEI